MRLRTEHMKPSQVLRLTQYHGTYDRAVAWLAVENPNKKFGPMANEYDFAILVVADLFGIECGQVQHDVMQAQKREAIKLIRSVKDRRLSV